MRANILVKCAVILFFIWHSLAIAIYSIPDKTESNIAISVRKNYRQFIRPYLLITSQWQNWSMFSPDPLRTVTEFDIEMKEGLNEWKKLETVSFESTPWQDRAIELKVVRRLMRENKELLREQYTLLSCEKYHLKEGTTLRLHIREFTIPMHEMQQTVGWWENWQPEWQHSFDEITVCPTRM